MQYLQIERILVVNGARIARITDPSCGRRRSHGLGAVGDPLRPFLGHRVEGYELVLPADLARVIVEEVYAEGERPRRAPWTTLRASDLPTLDAMHTAEAETLSDGREVITKASAR